jgi:S-adenosylmethionine decarboxylase
MAFNDALFQLGMDLTRSSTAQKEDHGQAALMAHEDGNAGFQERGELQCAGTHLSIDLFGARRLDDLHHIRETLRRCVEVAEATLLHIHLHRSLPEGSVSAVAVLAEGHISLHGWPQRGNAALDVFMGGAAKPRAAIDAVEGAFVPTRTIVKERRRLKPTSRRSAARERPRAAA